MSPITRQDKDASKKATSKTKTATATATPAENTAETTVEATTETSTGANSIDANKIEDTSSETLEADLELANLFRQDPKTEKLSWDVSKIKKGNVNDKFTALGKAYKSQEDEATRGMLGSKTNTLIYTNILGTNRKTQSQTINKETSNGVATMGYRFVSTEPIVISRFSPTGEETTENIPADTPFDTTLREMADLMCRVEYDGKCVQPFESPDEEGNMKTYNKVIGFVMTRSATEMVIRLRPISTNAPAVNGVAVEAGSLKQDANSNFVLTIDYKDEASKRYVCKPEFEKLFGHYYNSNRTSTSRSASDKRKAVVGETSSNLAAALRALKAKAKAKTV